MKKIFTLICAMMLLVGTSFAQTALKTSSAKQVEKVKFEQTNNLKSASTSLTVKEKVELVNDAQTVFTPQMAKKDKHQIARRSSAEATKKVAAMRNTNVTIGDCVISTEYEGEYYVIMTDANSTTQFIFDIVIEDEFELGRTYTFDEMLPDYTGIGDADDWNVWTEVTDASYTETKDEKGLTHVVASMTTEDGTTYDLTYDEPEPQIIDVVADDFGMTDYGTDMYIVLLNSVTGDLFYFDVLYEDEFELGVTYTEADMDPDYSWIKHSNGSGEAYEEATIKVTKDDQDLTHIVAYALTDKGNTYNITFDEKKFEPSGVKINVNGFNMASQYMSSYGFYLYTAKWGDYTVQLAYNVTAEQATYTADDVNIGYSLIYSNSEQIEFKMLASDIKVTTTGGNKVLTGSYYAKNGDEYVLNLTSYAPKTYNIVAGDFAMTDYETDMYIVLLDTATNNTFVFDPFYEDEFELGKTYTYADMDPSYVFAKLNGVKYPFTDATVKVTKDDKDLTHIVAKGVIANGDTYNITFDETAFEPSGVQINVEGTDLISQYMAAYGFYVYQAKWGDYTVQLAFNVTAERTTYTADDVNIGYSLIYSNSEQIEFKMLATDITVTTTQAGKTLTGSYYAKNGDEYILNLTSHVPQTYDVVADDFSMTDYDTDMYIGFFDAETGNIFYFDAYYEGSFEFGKVYTYAEMDHSYSFAKINNVNTGYKDATVKVSLDDQELRHVVAKAVLTNGDTYNITYDEKKFEPSGVQINVDGTGLTGQYVASYGIYVYFADWGEYTVQLAFNKTEAQETYTADDINFNYSMIYSDTEDTEDIELIMLASDNVTVATTQAGMTLTGSYYAKNGDEYILNLTNIEGPQVGDEFDYEGLTYEVTALGDENTAKVIGIAEGKGFRDEIVIPEEAEYMEVMFTVDEIGKNAFMSAEISTIEIPNTVKTIGDWAFAYSELTELVIPSSVNSIGSYVLSENVDLTTVTFAEGSELESLGEYMFMYCAALTTINSYIEEAPAATEGCFVNVPATCHIFVPYESLDSYKEANGWNAFANTIFPFSAPVVYGENITVEPIVESGEMVDYGTELVFTAANRELDNYEFVGFFADEEFTTPITEGVEGYVYTVTVENAISVYAKYEEGFGLQEIDGQNIKGVRKVIENGQVIIIRDGKKYNIFGVEID